MIQTDKPRSVGIHGGAHEFPQTVGRRLRTSITWYPPTRNANTRVQIRSVAKEMLQRELVLSLKKQQAADLAPSNELKTFRLKMGGMFWRFDVPEPEQSGASWQVG